MVNANQKQNEQNNNLFKKVRDMELNVVEQLTKMSHDDRGDMQFSFNAHEESIKNVQDQILALEK